ncbi:MAG TPA: SDR family oxidoreductase [Dermatophilaceae bacterium]|nr:SDR family oxidoreductase [Dermatophilaceae bacterium]
MRGLAGRVAIVTGASRGIGLGIAERLVAEGARVCITARSPEPLQEAVTKLGGPDHAIAVPGRGDDEAHHQETVERALASFGRLDLLVNNTGINPVFGPLLTMDLSAARKMVEVNCLAVLSWVRLAHEAWLREHGGRVVNVASVGGLRTAPGIAFYGATKAMLIHLTQELAVELAPRIRVNAVAPAVVKTAFATPLYAGREDSVAATYPLRRLGEPEDIAGAVAFLLSDDAAWITGQTLVVDGGVTLGGVF